MTDLGNQRPFTPDLLRIEGGRRLAGGHWDLSGFKHSLVTVFAAAVASSARVTIGHVPDIAETAVLVGLLNGLGGSAERQGSTLVVDSTSMSESELDPEAGNIHGSAYLLPAMVARFGKATVRADGGCRIGGGTDGRRPVGQYADVLGRFGATALISTTGDVTVRADRLRGCTIDLLDYTTGDGRRTGPLYSGASKMAVLCAAVAHGTSRLSNLYPKPDVEDLIEALNRMGLATERDPEGTLVIMGRGVEGLSTDAHVTLTSDLIETVTLAVAGFTACRAPLTLRCPDPARVCAALRPELTALEGFGLGVTPTVGGITVEPAIPTRSTPLVATSHGIYSDSLPFLVLLASWAPTLTDVRDEVWINRFGYIPGLNALGTVVREVDDHHWTVDGPCPPTRAGARLSAPDLRSAATLLLAALTVAGPTLLRGASHLDRGYSGLVSGLRGLGADIREQPPDEVLR